MIKQPIILAEKVPKGNLVGMYFPIAKEVRYLKMLPKPPPKPTINKDLIISIVFSKTNLMKKAKNVLLEIGIIIGFGSKGFSIQCKGKKNTAQRAVFYIVRKKNYFFNTLIILVSFSLFTFTK